MVAGGVDLLLGGEDGLLAAVMSSGRLAASPP